jgi:hypothetical protein
MDQGQLMEAVKRNRFTNEFMILILIHKLIRRDNCPN